MILMLSGEGKTDMGQMVPTDRGMSLSRGQWHGWWTVWLNNVWTSPPLKFMRLVAMVFVS